MRLAAAERALADNAARQQAIHAALNAPALPLAGQLGMFAALRRHAMQTPPLEATVAAARAVALRRAGLAEAADRLSRSRAAAAARAEDEQALLALLELCGARGQRRQP